MLLVGLGRRAGKMFMMAAVALLLLATLAGAVGAGPDEPDAQAAVQTDAGPGAEAAGWDVFEGHAFTVGRLAPVGFPLVACLGGCEQGYISAPVQVGSDGRYEGLRVNRDDARAELGGNGDVVTFWLVGEAADSWERADQAVLFMGSAGARELHLSFEQFPQLPEAAGTTDGVSDDAPAPAVDELPGWHTTDLTLPAATELGLVPRDSAANIVADTFRYGGLPLLPGFGMVLGLLLLVIGASLLIYRRRIIW